MSMAATVTPIWGQLLSLTDRKAVASSVANVMLILTHDERWIGRLRHNVFANRIVLDDPPFAKDCAVPDRAYPCDLRDSDAARVCSWLQREYQLRVGADMVNTAIVAVAEQAPFHPVRDYLEGVKWDGVSRVDSWLTTYLGAVSTPYARSVGAWWLISAVARIYQPGCKVDYSLVFESPDQGDGKSGILRALADPWVADELPDLHNKDAAQQLPGVWLLEIAELATLIRSDPDVAKKFLTQRIDRYRPTYGRYAVDVPRTTVFAGTTNKREYLRDDTGNRRFWPVWCAAIDLDSIRRDRDQIWAEAREMYRGRRPWWPDREMIPTLQAEQGSRDEHDVWEETIAPWLDKQFKHIPVSVSDVLRLALEVDAAKQTRGDQMRVQRVLLRLGMKLHRRKLDRVYEHPGWWAGVEVTTPPTVTTGDNGGDDGASSPS